MVQYMLDGCMDEYPWQGTFVDIMCLMMMIYISYLLVILKHYSHANIFVHPAWGSCGQNDGSKSCKIARIVTRAFLNLQ
jgi:hypothetical protein